MSSSQSPAAEASASLWTLATGEPTAGQHEAKTQLAEAYGTPVYGYFRAWGYEADAAAAMVELLMGRFVHGQSFPAQTAESARGCFLALAGSAAENPEALMEGGDNFALPIDRNRAESRFAAAPPRGPEETFNYLWARIILEATMALLSREYSARDEERLYQELRVFLGYGVSGDAAYEQAAQALGVTTGTARHAVYQLRRRFREILCAQIGDTVPRVAEIESEITSLLSFV